MYSIYKISMSILNQKTIKNLLKFTGVGLHSGKKVTMKLFPAPPNTGIIFKRSDLKNHNLIYPNVFNVSSASYCTKITNENGISVSTIEHLMAALCGLGVDNLLIDLNSEELPIMDGSAKNFVDSIQNVGFEVSDQPIRIIKINKKIVYSDGEKFISFEPNKISLEIDFEIKGKLPIKKIKCFTTRPDTLFGFSFLAVSVDHPLCKSLEKQKNFIEFKKKSSRVGTTEEAIANAEKIGFDSGLRAKHPFIKNKTIPVFVANFER